MAGALFQVTLTSEDRQPTSKTYLWYNKRVGDFFRSGAEEVTFWYKDIGDGRWIPRECKTAMTIAAFKTLIEEADGWPTVSFNAVKMNTHCTNSRAVGYLTPVSNLKRWVTVEFFVKAEDKPSSMGTGCWVWLDRGDFKLIVFDSTNTVDEIEGAASGSGSLS